MRLTEQDHARVTAAVTAAEAGTDGEIVTIVAPASDAYHDVALHWSLLMMFLVLAVIAVWPDLLLGLHAELTGGWAAQVPHSELLTLLLVLLAIKFLLARLLFGWPPLRMALTPGATKSRRVRRRAVDLFRAAAERRTRARTGVLLYVSLAEHRAELVADAAIHGRVPPERWGDAMAALVSAMKDNRPGEGLADAVTQVGAILTESFPRSASDIDELPDRLIEL